MRIQSFTPINVKLNSINIKNNCSNKNDIGDVYVLSNKTNPTFGSGNLPSNFGEIVEGKLFRGALPTAENFDALKAKGVTFILDLCGDNREKEAEMAKQYGMDYFYENGDDLMLGFSKDNYKKTTMLVDKKIKNGCGYVHDNQGKSRSGMFAAYYQAKKGETPEKILEHAEKHGGYLPSIESLLLCIKDGVL